GGRSRRRRGGRRCRDGGPGGGGRGLGGRARGGAPGRGADGRLRHRVHPAPPAAVRAHGGQLAGGGRADRAVFPGGQRRVLPGAGTQRGAIGPVGLRGVLAGRGDQRVVDSRAVHRAVVRLTAGDPPRGLDPQVVTHVRLDDDHVEVLVGGLRRGDEGLLHAVPDLRQIGTGDLDG